MPHVAVYQSGNTTSIAGASSGPNAHLGLSLLVFFCINPPFGLIALIFSCWSKATLARDWDGALLRGKIAFGFAVCGIVITVVAILGFVLIFYTRDT